MSGDRMANDEREPAETRARLADQLAWIELLRAQGAALAERRPT